jgi:hypothetical protein
MSYTTETLVEREILCCISAMLNAISPVAEQIEGYDTFLSLLGHRIDEDDELEEFEVYEHWVVSNWLADKLRAKGEIVEDYLGLTIWGRTTTGQRISLDSVIQEIVDDVMK